MGYSTPKKPFNIPEFLKESRKPMPRRFVRYGASTSAPKQTEVEEDSAATPASGPTLAD